MRKLQAHNYQLPTTNDLNAMQSQKEAAIKSRGSDLLSWGILRANSYPAALDIPVSSTNPAPNLRQAIGELTLQFDTNSGLLSVGAGSDPGLSPPVVGGVAYDLNWERVAIEQDLAFNFDNNIPEGLRSSGNLNIPLTLTGTSGGASSNPSTFGTYYFWLEYLGVNDTTYPLVDRLGVTFWPLILDGYKILITSTPVAPNGDGISIFLAKLVWAAAFPEVITLTDGEVTRSNGNSISTIPTAVAGEPKRVYCLARAQAIEVIPSSALRPTNYAEGERHTLADHGNAIGSGTVTPKNPHALALVDIPGGTAEPKATTNLKESLTNGFLDFDLDQNSPSAQSSAGLPTIEQNSLTPAGLNSDTILGTGIDSTVKDAWVRVHTLGAQQVAYLTGIRLKRLYPSLRETSDHTSDPSIDPADADSGDGWIGFSSVSGSADPVGTYRLFGQPATLNGQDVLLVNKELLSAYPSTIPDLAAGLLPIGQVYWDGNDLYRDSLKAQVATNLAENKPIDNRTLGLVGPAQLSTDLKQQALRGQTPQNLIGNSSFMFNKVSTQFPGWAIDATSGAGYLPNAAIVQLTSGTDPLLVSGGPGALFGAILTPTAGQTTGTTKLYAQIGYLKPNTYYGLAFWYRADSGWNSRVRVGIADGNSGSPASVITTGSPYPGPLDVNVLDDGVYHQATLVVKTNSLVVDDLTGKYYLELEFDATALATVAGKAFRITNVQVTEGEWIPGYMSQSDPSVGSLLFFDDRTTCPPGSREATEFRGLAVMGYNPSGTGNITPGLSRGTPVTDATSNGNIGVTSTSPNSASTADQAAAGGAASWIRIDAHNHTEFLPYRTVLVCRKY